MPPAAAFNTVRISRRCAAWFSLWGLIAGGMAWQSLVHAAGLLAELPPVTVTAGTTVNARITPLAPVGTELLLRLEGGDPDARLVSNPDGSFFLRWPTPLDLPPTTELTVTAVNVNDPSQTTQQTLLVYRAVKNNADGRADYLLSDAPDAPDAPVAPVAPVLPDTPDPEADLNQPAGQIAQPRVNRRDLAATTPGIPPHQTLVAGRRWEFYFRARDALGPSPAAAVSGLPAGAVLTSADAVSVDDSWYRIRWTPARDQSGEYQLILNAVNASAADPANQQVLSLTVGADTTRSGATPPEAAPLTTPAPETQQPSTLPPGAAPMPSALPPGAASPPQPSPPDAALPPAELNPAAPSPQQAPPAPIPEAPELEPLATQIISAGRVVSVPVYVKLNDGATPVLSVDRLPRNASFELNVVGVPVFHWLTGDSDQGEHRFRFTASHPDFPQAKTTRDLTILVGDPTRSKTVPR